MSRLLKIGIYARVLVLSNTNWSACSRFTCRKYSQVIQDTLFSANSPWTLPPQSVPATAQQYLPAFFPPFTPLWETSVAAGHTPRSLECAPPGCLPQFFTSQQFRAMVFLSLPSSYIFSIQEGLSAVIH